MLASDGYPKIQCERQNLSEIRTVSKYCGRQSQICYDGSKLAATASLISDLFKTKGATHLSIRNYQSHFKEA